MCARLTHICQKFEMCLLESSPRITGISHVSDRIPRGKIHSIVFEVGVLRQHRVLYTLDWPLQALTCTSTACIHRAEVVSPMANSGVSVVATLYGLRLSTQHNKASGWHWCTTPYPPIHVRETYYIALEICSGLTMEVGGEGTT